MSQEARPLEAVLDREIEVARLLASTLAAERTALTGDTPDDVSRIAAEKIRLFEAFEKLDAQRRVISGDTEVPERANGGGQGARAAVADRWRSLMELMAKCRTANEINGQIIHARRGQVRQLIDIVRGGPAITYNANGKTFSRALRALARA